MLEFCDFYITLKAKRLHNSKVLFMVKAYVITVLNANEAINTGPYHVQSALGAYGKTSA